MAYEYKVGNFQLNTSTGSQSITSIGFQPKALLFFHHPNTVAIGVPQIANWYHTIGMVDGTNSYSMWTFAPNGNAGLESTGFMQSTAIVGGNDFATLWAFNVTSLTGSGFDINITQAPPDVYWLGYMAFGGADVDVKVGSFNGTGVGSQAVTGVGFQPTGLIIHTIGRSEAYTVGATPVTSAANTRSSFGFSDGVIDRCAGFSHRDAGLTVKLNGVVQRNDSIIGAPNYTTSPTMSLQSSVTSFDVNGFTLNNVYNHTGLKFMYIALGGMQCQVGQYQTPTITGISNVVSGLPFSPNALIQASSNQAVYNVVQGVGSASSGFGATYSYGMATDPGEQYNIEATGTDFTTTTYYGHYSSDVALHARYQYNNRGVLQEQSAFDAFTTDGFDINASTVVGSGNSAISYLAIEGDGGGPTPPDNPTGGSGGVDSPDSSFLFNMIDV